MAIECNQILTVAAELQQNFAVCKTLTAADMDLLVDLILAVDSCTDANLVQDNYFNTYDLGSYTEDTGTTDAAQVAALINALAGFTIDETTIGLFTVNKLPIGSNMFPRQEIWVALLNGKGDYGVGGTITLAAGDMFLMNPVQAETIRNTTYINTILGGQGILGGTVYPIQDLDFGWTRIVWYQNNVISRTNIGTVTLSPAHPTLNRIDVFYVDTTTNTVQVAQGTPNLNPTEEVLDARTQIRITSALVPALSTGIDGFIEEIIYNENVGEGTEWTVSATAATGTVDLDNTTGSLINTKHFRGTALTTGDDITAFNDSAIDPDLYESLNMGVYNAGGDNIGFSVYLTDGTNIVSNVILVQNGEYGFVTDGAGYSYVDIPLNILSPTANFTTVVIEFDSLSEADIDDIRIDRIRLLGGLDVQDTGALSYLDLNDTFDINYTNKAGFVPMVNNLETGLQLVDSAPFVEFTDLYTGNAVINGGVIHLTGLNYRIWWNSFIVENVYYEETGFTDVTINVADATNPRIDVFVVNKDDANTAAYGSVVTGTPNASPEKPNLAVTQAEAGFKIVVASEPSTPPEITTEDIYVENLGEPTEWDVNSVDANASTSATVTGDGSSFSVFLDPSTGDTDASVQFLKASTLTWDPTERLVMDIATDFNWFFLDTITFAFGENGVNSNAGQITLNPAALLTRGFDTTQVGVWQTLVIDLAEFGYTLTDYDLLTITFNNPGGQIKVCRIDNIRIQTSISEPPVGGNLGYLDLNDSTDTDYTGKAGYAVVVNAGETGTELQAIGLNPDLQEVIDNGGLAQSADTNSYIDIDLSNGAAGYFDLWHQNGTAYGGIFTDSTSGYLYSSTGAGTTGQVETLAGILKLQQTTGGINADLLFTTPTVTGHDYLIPARTDAATTSTLAIGVTDGATTVYSTSAGLLDISTLNAGAFEVLDEGSGDGIVIKDRTAANFGNVGLGALDASTSTGPSGTIGATGDYAFAVGVDVIASGDYSVNLGTGNTTSGLHSWAIARNSVASGDYSAIVNGLGNNATATGSIAGGDDNDANGNYSIALNQGNFAKSYGETAIGIYATDYTASSTSAYSATDRLFNIGRGTSKVSQADAFTVLKNGKTGIGIDNFETTADTELLQVAGTVLATGYVISGGLSTETLRADGSSETSIGATNTGTTVLVLNNVQGTTYDTPGSPNSATVYTTTGAVNGGSAQVYIDALSEPTVTGATKISGAAFTSSTLMYLNVRYNGVRTEFWFSEI